MLILFLSEFDSNGARVSRMDQAKLLGGSLFKKFKCCVVC